MKTGPAREKALEKVKYIKNIFPTTYSVIEIYGNYGQVRLQGLPCHSNWKGQFYFQNIPDCLFCANTISKKEVLSIIMEGNEDKYVYLHSEQNNNFYIFNLKTLHKSGFEFLGLNVRYSSVCRVKVAVRNLDTGKYGQILEILLRRIEDLCPLLEAFKKTPGYEKEYENFQKAYEELRIPALQSIVRKKNEQYKKVQSIEKTISNQTYRKNQFIEALLSISKNENIDFPFAMRHHIEDPVLREELTKEHVQIHLAEKE